MTLIAVRGRLYLPLIQVSRWEAAVHFQHTRTYASASLTRRNVQDPRLDSLGPVIEDDYANLREQYDCPKNPIVLAHGLLGFDELHIAGPKLPGVHYWRGITDALAARGIDVYTASVPASASIEVRATKLAGDVQKKARGRSVNIIAHSMGGLDARHMISCLKPSGIKVLSLTTVATPHRGSTFADFVLNQIGPIQLPKIYKTLEHFGISTGAFSQLSQTYMRETFNPATPDLEGVKYYSYGATFAPRWYSLFRQSHAIVLQHEGPNDGLVSVESSQWGQYKGTLTGVSHLDLINWTNRLRWFVWELTGNKRNFNAIAFYLSIADMLAKQGL